MDKRVRHRFQAGDRVRDIAYGSRGTVLGLGTRPGIEGTVARYLVQWDASGFRQWCDEYRLDAITDEGETATDAGNG